MQMTTGIAIALIAAPAAGGQYMAFEGVKGESTDARCARGGEAINGGLNRDIIRRIPGRPKPKPRSAEARGGVQVAAGDLDGDGRAAGRGDITLKRGGGARGCR